MSTKSTPVIVAYARTPFARASKFDGNDNAVPGREGAYHNVHPLDLAGRTINTVLDQSGMDPRLIHDVLLGTAFPEFKQGLNAGRLVSLHPDVKLTIASAGKTTNRFCGSSMDTIHDAAARIAFGTGHSYISTGMEMMSMNPKMSGLNPDLHKKIKDGNAMAFMDMGVTAENLARKYNISRELQDQFAVASHMKALSAYENGFIQGELVSMEPFSGLDYDN